MPQYHAVVLAVLGSSTGIAVLAVAMFCTEGWYAATMLCRVCCYVLPGPDGGMLLCVGRYVLSGINKGMLLRVGRYVDRVARRRKPARVHDERKLRAGDRPIKGVFVRMVPGISVLAFDFAVCYGLRLCSAMSSTSVGHAAT